MPIVDQTIYEEIYYSYGIIAQTQIPSCAAPPAPCTLYFTSIGSELYSVTNVTLRGDNDGTITVQWSGSTGTTSCYINGVLDGTEAGNTHTYTGLSAGYYNILIEEGDCFDTINNIQILDGEFRTGDFTVNTPAALCAAENPILLNLQTARNTGNPQPSKFIIDVDATIDDGDSITFTFTYPQAYRAVFYAKSFPNRGNYFLASILKDGTGVAVGSNSLAEIATSIAEVLENDSVISRLYFISVTDNRVYLTAKENSDKLDMTTVCTTTGGALDLDNVQNGNADYDGAISQDYSLYCNILINPYVQYGEDPADATFNKVAQLELPFNAINNTHLFDLSEILKNFVSTPKIDFTLTGFTTVASMLAGYRIEYGEKYPLVQNSTTKKSRVKGTVDTKYLLNSALPWEDANDMTGYLGSILHNISKNFTGTFQNGVPSAQQSTLTITNYLIDTGSTKTTNIMFKVNDTYNSQVYDWQTGTTFVLTGDTSYPYGGMGYVYVSGLTSGSTLTFSKNFQFWTAFGSAANMYGGANNVYAYNDVQWLTNSPNPKFVQRDSSEFLYLMLPKDYGKTLSIRGDLYFYDGTSLIDEELYTVSTGSTNWGGVFMFAAGYNELNLASYETYSGGTRKIRRVDFALHQTDASGTYNLSEEKSYRYEIDEQPRRYGVAFLNKLGTYDIFDFAGEIVDSVTHSNERYEVPRALGQEGNSPYGFQANTVYNTKVTKTIAANTGWIDENHFDWLIELLESNRCYNYTETDQSFLIVSNVDYKKSSNDDLYQIDVTFTETLYQNNISV